MSFFDALFRKEENSESVILVDISADSVAGAYVRYVGSEPPKILYAEQMSIEARVTNEAHERAMLRALAELGNDLIRKGAPALARFTGSGTASRILVSIDEPWQETHVRTEHFEQDEPFIFTRELVEAKLAETDRTPSEKILADTSIIGTTLNGYETSNPYGKSAHRAAIIVLTSLIERHLADDISSTLGGLFHTRNIFPIAGSSLRYQTMRALFPHERDALIVDATGKTLTSISLFRKGMFVTMTRVAVPSDNDAWVAAIMEEFGTLSKHYPLPRTIFLLAREQEVAELRERFDAAKFSLWLGDGPPKIVSVQRSLIGASVRQLAENIPDTILLLMTLFYRNQREASGEGA